jgi:hypothetical protein
METAKILKQRELYGSMGTKDGHVDTDNMSRMLKETLDKTCYNTND